MMRLKRRYTALAAKFLGKRAKFLQAITALREKGKWDAYKRLNDVLQEADALKLEIAQGIALSAPADKKVLKGKLKKFKNCYTMLNQETKPQWQQWVEAIGVALVLCVILRNFLFSLYHVPTGSAEKTILVGDRIWGNKTAYFFDTIKRNDMVIFDDPRQGYDETNYLTYLWQRYVGFPIPLLGLRAGPINVVKRVIAVPGDVIEGRVEDGKTVIYRNNEKLDESYLNPYPLIYLKKDKGFIKQGWLGPITVPGFLAKEKAEVSYTYDPSVPYEEQPYYCMDESEIIKHPQTGMPILREPRVPDYARSGRCIDEFGPIRLPENKYWVMGDSRKNSDDSRGWGFLDKKFVHGRASFVIYSVDSEEALWLFDVVKHPIDFWTKHVRWSRFFKPLK